MQCSVGQKRDESAGPCTPDCDRRPAAAIDEAGVDGVKHGAAPARVNKGQGAAGRPSCRPRDFSLVSGGERHSKQNRFPKMGAARSRSERWAAGALAVRATAIGALAIGAVAIQHSGARGG